MLKSFILPFLLIVALAGCGASESEPGPGGISVEDAKALDDAAEKLDAEAAGKAD